MKTLRRTVIIRDADLDSLLQKTVKKQLYDRVDVETLTYASLQQEIMIEVLKKGRTGCPEFRVLPDLYEQMLWREPGLYDRRYLDWQFTMDYPAGQIYVQSRDKHPRQPLYRVTFERDY
jgi:hypothetical protein